MADVHMADADPLIEEVKAEEGMQEDRPAVQETAEERSAQDVLHGTYEWVVKDFPSMQETKLYSPKFEIGTYIWRLLLFPRGNPSTQQGKWSMSVYLDAPEAQYTPVSMSPKAAFKLILVNKDPAKNFFKDSDHVFTANQNDWGFTAFIPLEDVNTKENGFLDSSGTLRLQVEITVKRDEKYTYDSRKKTGCVGLKNQGATCYMNSLLQYLYHLPCFRKAVYHMPTSETEDPSKSMPLALQTLFYRLQYSRLSVSTKDLTKSFGWGTYDAFMQHDVQELNRVLQDKLETKMKGTSVEKVIPDLFEGRTESFIECVSVPGVKSARLETFQDLSLDVKGCANIYSSFEKYTEVELMDGANQWKTETHGLQDARKGVLFHELPPVLQLQLKRFEYDYNADTNVKINDRYEFYDEIDLDMDGRKLLTAGSDARVRNRYKLHSVLVHSGGVHGGHYYAFIRPDGTNWLKFDDDQVSTATSKQAIEEQYGGEDEAVSNIGHNNAMRYTKFSNAYMLVYVRESEWERIMCPVTKDDIAEHLREKLEMEQREKEQRTKEKEEAHMFCHLRVATDDDIEQQVGTKGQMFDLVNHDSIPPERGQFRMPKQNYFREFKRQVEERFGIPVSKQRYWTWHKRSNDTFRVKKLLTPSEEESQLLDLRDHREMGSTASKHALLDIRLFLETPVRFNKDLGKMAFSPQHDNVPKSTENCLLFCKHYDPMTEKLRYIGRLLLPTNMAIHSKAPPNLCHVMRSMAGLPESCPVSLYEEVKFEPSVFVDELDMKKTIGQQGEREDGDIIIVQPQLSEEEAAKCRFPNCKVFLEYIKNRRIVRLRKQAEPKEEGFELELMKETTYDQVALAVAAKLKLEDPSKLRFTQHNVHSHLPQRLPLRFRQSATLEDMLRYGIHSSDILYYEVLDMPLEQLEMLKTLRVTVHNARGEPSGEHNVRVAKDAHVGDALSELQRLLGPGHPTQGQPLRLMTVTGSRIFKVCDPGDPITSFDESYWTLRAEAIPEPQREIDEASGARLVQVCHVQADKASAATSAADTAGVGPASDQDVPGPLPAAAAPAALLQPPQHCVCFGDPFLLRLEGGDTVGSVRARIKTKLGVSDEEFSKWHLVLVSRSPTELLLDDAEVLAPRFAHAQNALLSHMHTPPSGPAHLYINEQLYLGLVHENTKPRRANNAYRGTFERPVQIFT